MPATDPAWVVSGSAPAGGGRLDRRLEAGQAQVQHLDGAVGGPQQVRRLDVPVDDPLAVGMAQAPGRLRGVIDGHGDRQRPPLLDEAMQVPALDVLHDEEGDAPGLVGVVGRDDVGVRQRRRRPDLPAEPPELLRGIDGAGGQDLQGDDPIHRAVEGPEDDAHAAGAEQVQDDVAVDQQRVAPPLQEDLGLVLGELALVDEPAGQPPGVLGRGVGGEVPPELADLLGGQEAAVGNGLDEALGGDRRRLSPILGRGWVAGGLPAGGLVGGPIVVVRGHPTGAPRPREA